MGQVVDAQAMGAQTGLAQVIAEKATARVFRMAMVCLTVSRETPRLLWAFHSPI